MTREPFGIILARLRTEAGLSVTDLAERAGVSRQTLHNLETGKYRPTWDVVQRLAGALGVPTDVFRDGGAPAA